jgi:hypothetical protein
MRSTVYWPSGIGGTGWDTYLNAFGLDRNIYIEAYTCRDEFNDWTIDFCYNGLAYYWTLPDAYGDIAEAQKFSAVGSECRLQEVSFLMYWHRSEYALPLYSTNTALTVYDDAAGLPGAVQTSVIITPADWLAAGMVAPPGPAGPSTAAWFTYDFTSLNIDVAGDYWVGLEPVTADPDSGIRTLSDAGGGPCTDSWAENYLGAWELMSCCWGGVDASFAMVAEAQTCCIPFTGRVCAPGEEWPTYQHDGQRTGASQNSIGDAWCDLTLIWNYEDPLNINSFCGPIIAHDAVVQAFTDHIVKLDLTTGAVLATLPYSPPLIGASLRTTPTVESITGYADPVLFVSGGDQQSVAAYNYRTMALLWARTVATVGIGNLWGQTRFGRFVVVTISGTDYVFWGTDNGRVIGVNALTGDDPGNVATYNINLTQATGVSGATDGTDLYFTTGLGIIDGDVFSLSTAVPPGSINWQLSGTSTLQADEVYDPIDTDLYVGPENFWSGVSVDLGPLGPALYTNSYAEGGYPVDGVFYEIDPATGMVNYALVGNQTRYNCPVIDINHVYMPSLSQWVTPPAGGDIYAFNKSTGTIQYAVSGSGSGGGFQSVYTDAILSCEPEPAADILMTGNLDGFISYFDATNFNELFTRRVARGPQASSNNWIMGSAMGPDTTDGDVYVAHTNRWGDVMVLSKQDDDRPRLEILSYNITAPVEFGPAPSLIVTIPGVFTNTGCADLTFETITADENEFVPFVPLFSTPSPVEEELMAKASILADNLTFLARKLARTVEFPDPGDLVNAREESLLRETQNRAATAFPPYLNSVDEPYAGQVIAQGETTGVVLNVIQAGFTRGPHPFYIELESDDPDFFLDDTTRAPQIRVTLVGGCLIDTTTLHFGVGAANNRLVTNTGRVGTGDWAPHAYEIDADNDDYYQGSLLYAVSTHRIAVSTQDWTSGGGEIDAFYSLQGDPNWCDNDCKPFLDASVTLGEITYDGGNTYSTINGEMVCRSFIDSVQNYDLGAGWDWSNFGAPFDNDSTMGLYVNSRVVGAVDVPELANLTLDILEFEERNGNNVNNWFLGEIWDEDVISNGGAFDTVACDPSISTVWNYTVGGPLDNAIGQVKIPFGCGYDPLINCWAEGGLSGAPGHGFWGWGIFWDSAYSFLSAGTGSFSDGNVSTFSDGEGMATYAGKDFGPNDTLSLGIAHFALYNIAGNADESDAYADFAHLINKWAGFGRGDVNNDNAINLADIIYLAGTVAGGPGAAPFRHLSDVNADGNIDALDVDFLIDFYFRCGPCPIVDWIF